MVDALAAPSGAGSAPRLHIAGLLENPTSGRVLIGGQDCASLGDSGRTRLRRDAIGFVYQFHHLLPEFSARENVMIPQMVAGLSAAEAGRSEERRVGKECVSTCRSRCSPGHKKKKK